LENLVFKQLIDKNKLEDINFWRTQNKNEIDFVMEKYNKAYEVKVNKDKFLI
jgi:predicted AAA+ superfamily ATPase